MTALRSRSRQPKQLDAGVFQAEFSSFRLYLAAEGKSAKTVRTYTEAVQWFAAAHLLAQTSRAGWEEVDEQDVQRCIVRLLARYSGAYASNQYRALQQFFKWLAAEEELPDPMAMPHAASTATSASAPAMRRRTGRSYGSGSATGGR